MEARLAVEHCVHEARGLDVLPRTINKFRGGGDEVTAKLLETVVRRGHNTGGFEYRRFDTEACWFRHNNPKP